MSLHTALIDSRDRLRFSYRTMSNVSSVAIAKTRLCAHFIDLRRVFPRYQPRRYYVSCDDTEPVMSAVTSVTHPHCVIVSLSPAQAGVVEKKPTTLSRGWWKKTRQV